LELQTIIHSIGAGRNSLAHHPFRDLGWEMKMKVITQILNDRQVLATRTALLLVICCTTRSGSASSSSCFKLVSLLQCKNLPYINSIQVTNGIFWLYQSRVRTERDELQKLRTEKRSNENRTKNPSS
jgi:hypothetical protein